jgi:ribosomal protein S27E
VSLRPDGIFTKVVCDGCGAEHRTTEALPVLAHYGATLQHGWRGGSEFYPVRPGVYCPECQEAS